MADGISEVGCVVMMMTIENELTRWNTARMIGMKGGVEFGHCIALWYGVFAALKAHVHVFCKNVGNERRSMSIVARQG
jgi:hypothetical protein